MKLSNNLSFVILIFAILKFWNVDRSNISSFEILTPTPVSVQISEDVPVPGEVLVAEGIRVPEDIGVPEGVRAPEKNWNYPTRPNPKKMFYPHTPNYNNDLPAIENKNYALQKPFERSFLTQ